MTRQHIRNLTMPELREVVTSHGEPEYRYRQLAKWLYEKLADTFADMTDLPAGYRDLLEAGYSAQSACVVSMQESAIDGTRKYLFELHDGGRIESVMMPYDQRTTLCVSSQVGCPLDCVFCETAKGKFQRNLTAGEIVDQVCVLKRDAGLAGRKVNVVFMGMGEPLLNFDEVVRSIRILNDPLGLDMGAKRITVSTSSFPDRIRALADADVSCSLALSLNAPNDETRSTLMPKAARFAIEELLEAANYFVQSGNRRATLEYILLSGINTKDEDAAALAELARGYPFKLNLIPYNPGRQSEFDSISEADIDRFVRQLVPKVPTVTVRRSRGLDIDAACGQLWTKSLTEKEKPVKEAGE